MDFETQVKLAVYRHFARAGGRPSAEEIAAAVGSDADSVVAAFAKLRAERVLALEADGATIRMAPPFSGVPTEHVVTVAGASYFANCAWDALGVVAALGRPGLVDSRCGHSGEPLRLEVGRDGPGPSGWLFHSLVPAARWWEDIVFT